MSTFTLARRGMRTPFLRQARVLTRGGSAGGGGGRLVAVSAASSFSKVFSGVSRTGESSAAPASTRLRSGVQAF